MEGNPTQVYGQVKIETADDWVSPRDSRFRIRRTYRSDNDFFHVFGARDVYYAYGEVWRQEFAEAVYYDLVASPNKHTYYRSSGEVLRFDAIGLGAATHGGHKFELEAAPEDVKITDGGESSRYFSGSYGTYFLDKVEWTDGYSITIERFKQPYNNPNNGRIDALSANDGTRAEFTYVTDAVPSSTRQVVSQIEIDVDYDEVTFAPEIRIEYDYIDNAEVPDKPKLTEVRRMDLVAGTSEVIWKYEYDIEFFQPALLKVFDGRTDATGQMYPYMSATYTDFDSSDYAGVISVAHPGGTDAMTMSPSGPTNALGLTTTYEFTPIQGLDRLSGANGSATPNCLSTTRSLGYTPNAGAPEGWIYERVERNGARTTYTRDARGRMLTRTEDADGAVPRVTTYTWSGDTRRPATRTTDQLAEAFSYTTDGLLESYSQTDVLVGSPDNGKTRTWSYSYTTLASGRQMLSSVDGPGLTADGVYDVTSYSYDADGNLTAITDPNGWQTQFLAFNGSGQPTLMRKPDTTEWAFAYDIMGRVTSITFDPNGNNPTTSSFAYDVIGQMVSYTNHLGTTWTFDYDEARRLVKTTNPTGDVATYDHDLLGNVTRVEYSDGSSTASFWQDTEYDALSRLVSTTGAEGQVWQFSHDVEDNLDSMTDPLSLQSTNSFDALNRVVDTIDRAGYSTGTEHDSADRVTRYTDPRAIDTMFTYNGFGDLVSEVSADRGTVSMSYNNRGLVASMTDGRGVVSNYTYDNGGRLTARRFPSDPSQDQTFTYDLPYNFGQGYDKIGRVRGPAGFTEYRYKNGGFLDTLRQRVGGVSYDVKFAFNREGMITRLNTPAKLEIKFNYDSDGNLSQITAQRRVKDPVTNQYPPKVTIAGSFDYLPNGPLTSVTLLDGSTHTATYDNSYRLTRLTDTLGTTALRDVSYGWSVRDNLELVTDHLDPTKSESYGYTAREFLASADGPWDELDFTYDAVGNRLSRAATVGGVTSTDSYSYPASSNRLTAIAGATARSFTHDAAGNVTYDNRTGVGHGYDYDVAGRLESFSLNGVVQAEYQYNPQGQQVLRRLTQTGQTFHVIFDADGNRLAEYEVDELAGTRTLLREYIWMEGVPIAVVENDQIYLVRTDHIGRPVFATDVNGVKVWEATYLPFGGVYTSTGANSELRFPGQWFQSESGLHQNWMRDYDPTTGRYLQADPLGLVAGASVYGYALQNPMYWTDPTGQCPWCLPAAVYVGFIVLDYYLDDDCYTWGDFTYSAVANLPWNRLFTAMRWAKRVTKGGDKFNRKGGGKNDGKRSNTDRIDEQLAQARERRDALKSKPNRTPEDKAALKRIEREIKRLKEQRRRSEPHGIDNNRH
ncbi:RHS repeat-associated core domain-containing protein [Aliiroseovarius sp.]|uniref:RHS repeat-associated core domain-containing protein n=1 Tax=Aliiroseovarius sp. TaxID=1872442 RepID=UPI003BA962EB